MLNFSEGVWAPTFFSHSNFEVKKFSEFINLQSTVDSEFYRGGVSEHQLFWLLKI